MEKNLFQLLSRRSTFKREIKKKNFGPFTKINQRYAIEYVLSTLDNTDEISRVSLVTDKKKIKI